MWTFWLWGPHVAKKCKRMHENYIFMFQINLLLLHVEPQAPANTILIFNRPPIFLYFSCLFGVFIMSTSHFLGKLFLFFTKYKFFKIQQVCFSGEMSLWIAQQLLSCWKTRLGFLKCFSKPRWWWDKILASLAYGCNQSRIKVARGL